MPPFPRRHPLPRAKFQWAERLTALLARTKQQKLLKLEPSASNPLTRELGLGRTEALEELMRRLHQLEAYRGTPEYEKEKKEEDEELVDGEDPVAHPETDEKDIELVMKEAGCGRREAIVALREKGNDLVEAIMTFFTVEN